MKPATLESASPFITSSTPRIMDPVMAEAITPERTIILGTSFCGSVISSAAPLESSKPTNMNCSRPMTARKPAMLGLRSAIVSVPSGLPFCTRKAMTRPRKMNRVSRRTMVPMMPVHLPYFISIMESITVTHTTTRPTTMDQKVLIGSVRMRLLMAATQVAARVPPIHTGLEPQ